MHFWKHFPFDGVTLLFFALICYFYHWTLFVLGEILVRMTFFRSIFTVGFNAEKSVINIALFIVKVIPYFFADVSLIIYGSWKNLPIKLNWMWMRVKNARTHTPPAHKKKNTLSKKNKIIYILLACLCYAMVESIWFVADIYLIFVLCAFWDVFVCLHIVCFWLDSVNSIFGSLQSNYQSKKSGCFLLAHDIVCYCNMINGVHFSIWKPILSMIHDSHVENFAVK